MEDTRPKAAHSRKIASIASLAPGAVIGFRWDNPPWDTVLQYTAYPLTRPGMMPGDATKAAVEVVRVRLCIERDADGAETRYALVDVRNAGTEMCGFELVQSWLQPLPE